MESEHKRVSKRAFQNSKIAASMSALRAPQLGRYVVAGTLIGIAFATVGLWTLLKLFGRGASTHSAAIAQADSMTAPVSDVERTAMPDEMNTKASKSQLSERLNFAVPDSREERGKQILADMKKRMNAVIKGERTVENSSGMPEDNSQRSSRITPSTPLLYAAPPTRDSRERREPVPLEMLPSPPMPIPGQPFDVPPFSPPFGPPPGFGIPGTARFRGQLPPGETPAPTTNGVRNNGSTTRPPNFNKSEQAGSETENKNSNANPASRDASEKEKAAPFQSDALAQHRVDPKRFLEFPECPPSPPSTPQKLLELKRPPEYQLSLLNPDKSTTRWELQPVVEAGVTDARIWSVLARAQGLSTKSTAVGEFVLRDGELLFRWTQRPAADVLPDSLRLCLLEIASAEQTARYFLRRPAVVDQRVTRKLDLDSTIQQLKMPPGIVVSDQLRFDVWIEGVDNSHSAQNVSLANSGSGSFELKSGDISVQFELIAMARQEGLLNDRHYELSVELMVTLPQYVKRGRGRSVMYERNDKLSPATQKAVADALKSVNTAKLEMNRQAERKAKLEENAALNDYSIIPDSSTPARRSRNSTKTSNSASRNSSSSRLRTGEKVTPDDEIGSVPNAVEDLKNKNRDKDPSRGLRDGSDAEIAQSKDRLKEVGKSLDELEKTHKIGFTAYIMNHGERVELITTDPAVAAPSKE